LKNKELTQNRIFFAHFASLPLRALRLILPIFKRKERKGFTQRAQRVDFINAFLFPYLELTLMLSVLGQFQKSFMRFNKLAGAN